MRAILCYFVSFSILGLFGNFSLGKAIFNDCNIKTGCSTMNTSCTFATSGGVLRNASAVVVQIPAYGVFITFPGSVCNSSFEPNIYFYPSDFKRRNTYYAFWDNTLTLGGGNASFPLNTTSPTWFTSIVGNASNTSIGNFDCWTGPWDYQPLEGLGFLAAAGVNASVTNHWAMASLVDVWSDGPRYWITTTTGFNNVSYAEAQFFESPIYPNLYGVNYLSNFYNLNSFSLPVLKPSRGTFSIYATPMSSSCNTTETLYDRAFHYVAVSGAF